MAPPGTLAALQIKDGEGPDAFDNYLNHKAVDAEQKKGESANVEEDVRIVYVPGRINLLGSYLDHTGYDAVSAATPMGVVIAVHDLTGKNLVSEFAGSKLVKRETFFKDEAVCLARPLNPSRAVTVRMHHIWPAVYPNSAVAFDITERIPVEPLAASRSWRSYVQAGLRAAQEYFLARGLAVPAARAVAGKDLLFHITGDLQPGVGLGSSSVLMAAVALAFCDFICGLVVEPPPDEEPPPNTEPLSPREKLELADLAGYISRAASLLGREEPLGHICPLFAAPNTVSRVRFGFPARATNYPVPRYMRLYGLNCLRDSRMAILRGNEHNKRACECRIGCMLLLKKWERDHPDKKLKERLEECRLDHKAACTSTLTCSEMQSIYGEESPAAMLKHVKSLPEKETLAWLVPRLNCDTLEEFIDKYVLGPDNIPQLTDLTPLSTVTIRARLLHVYSEAHRVRLFLRALESIREDTERLNTAWEEEEARARGLGLPMPYTPPRLPPQEESLMDYIAGVLGELLQQSHASCAEDCECSTPELDEVVELALKFGASGARLTGEGFGGHAVALVTDRNSDVFRQLFDNYYQKTNDLREVRQLHVYLDNMIFPLHPVHGCCIWTRTLK